MTWFLPALITRGQGEQIQALSKAILELETEVNLIYEVLEDKPT